MNNCNETVGAVAAILFWVVAVPGLVTVVYTPHLAMWLGVRLTIHGRELRSFRARRKAEYEKAIDGQTDLVTGEPYGDEEE